MTEVWVELGCDGPCACATTDSLARFPELPQTEDAARLWLAEHGCPACGSLDVTLEWTVYDDDDVC